MRRGEDEREDGVGDVAAAAAQKPSPSMKGHVGEAHARYVYGVLDLLSAGLYLFIFLVVVPSRSLLFTSAAVAMSLLVAAGGVGVILWTPRGRRLAMIASWALVAACAFLLVGLVTSVAYLHGIYDGVGQAGVAISWVVAALVIELVGLLPTLQIFFLRREARR